MKRNHKQHGLRRCTGGRDDQRGSAILLVLVAMVLMAILAGSLLQLTRFERIPRSESNIEVVIESVVDEIANQLTDDLLDDAGDYLNSAASAGGYDEPFDFPWTNMAVTGERTFEDKDGNSVTGIRGGRYDDTWLAAHMPDFGAAPGAGTVYSSTATDGTNGVWRKITSLTGLYLRGADGSSDLSSGNTVTEDPVNNAGVNFRDMNLTIPAPGASTILVDADGDGVGDSRWEWAPLRQVGATQYVMAVRIVDLSARMDLNVATRIYNGTGSTGAELGAGQPRGDSPSELDGSGFVGLTADAATTAIDSTTARAEWLDVLSYRLNGSGTAITNPLNAFYDGDSATPAANSRRELWTNGSSRVSNTFEFNGEDPTGATYDYTNAFGLNDAYELLQGNGLNSPTSTTVESLMPVFLRGGGVQEDGYGAGAGTNKPWTAVKDFWELDPRKHVSPFTGSSVAAKPPATGQARELKIDVNRAVETGNIAAISTAIERATTASLAALYPHLTNAEDVADQLAVNIADYLDDDNEVTTYNGKTGFEALPYITEVYTERIYDGTINVNAGDATMSTIDWEADTTNDVVGYVIEIGNPFGRQSGGSWVGRPVSLQNVFLGINGTRDTNDLASYAGAGKDTLDPGEVLIIYRNSSGNADAAENDLTTFITNANNTGSANITPVPATLTTEGPEMPRNTSEFAITLHAAAQDTTTALGWAYNAVNVEIGGATLPQETFDTTNYDATVDYQTYVQTSYRGVGEGLQMMTVTAEPGTSNGYFENITTLGTPQTNTTLPAATGPPTTDEGKAQRTISTFFDNESKGTGAPSGFGTIASQQVVWPDSKRNNGTKVGRMHWIGDVLHIPLIGPNNADETDKTMAGAFVSAGGGTTLTGGLNALYLPYQSSATTTVLGAGVLNYPQALLILEQLTTYSPATDGENGDGSTPPGTETFASPNDEEVLVPGRLNLNTAPRSTLIRLLPFPDPATRTSIADAIIARRESMTQNTGTVSYGMGANNIPGIAYTTALYEQIENLYITTNATDTEGDTTTLATSGVRVDLNDHETALGTYVVADGVIDDREEEIMLAKWITEVADTRSDVFAAYIVVQGYPIDSFTDGATESARLIVLFSRAGVKGTGDKAVEIGRFRIN